MADADADAYFGDDFGQKIDLTVRIREILRNYPGMCVIASSNRQENGRGTSRSWVDSFRIMHRGHVDL